MLANASEPLTLRLPMALGRRPGAYTPGASMPPALIVVAGTDPVPESVPSALTVTPALFAGIEPVTTRVAPELTVVAPR